jgi:hypothetical protein
MNTKQLLAAAAMLAATGSVLAEPADFVRPDVGFVSTKTRAEVIVQLKQAQADGSYQVLDVQYPGQFTVLANNTGTPVESFALSAPQGVKPVALKDGSTVYVFNDGKMGMENKYGHASQMGEGHVMETKDGQTMTMVGNETARTDKVLRAQYYGN